jgi:hypothetical protein
LFIKDSEKMGRFDQVFISEESPIEKRLNSSEEGGNYAPTIASDFCRLLKEPQQVSGYNHINGQRWFWWRIEATSVFDLLVLGLGHSLLWI